MRPSNIIFGSELEVHVHFWTYLAFRTIEMALEEVKEVDLDNRRVHVVVNELKPLIFEMTVEFHSGEDIAISLRYERLFSIIEDVSACVMISRNSQLKIIMWKQVLSIQVNKT